MAVKLLADKAGALQGMDANSISRSAYGPGVDFYDDPQGKNWPGYVGAIVRRSAERSDDEFEVLDYVLEVHDV
jgi:hypothetical protein